jgi:hypothetical protein
MIGRICLVDGCRGIYAPQSLARRGLDLAKWHLENNVADISTLLEGPDYPDYDEAWEAVLRAAWHVDDDGLRWTLEQDGDIFATCDDCM